MAIKVFGVSLSPFVRKVRVFCAEKQIPYSLDPVNPGSPPANWRQISPLGKIPALEHDGRYVNDSSVICAYLERVFPKTSLYPSDPHEYARALWLEEYIDGGAIPIAGPKVIGPVVVRPFLSGSAPDAAAIEQAEKAVNEDLSPIYAYLESQLGRGPFFVSSALSIADVAIASFFVNMRQAGFPVDAGRFPQLAGFVQRVHTRPSFAQLIEEERPVFGKRWA